MGTRSLTRVFDGDKEVACIYRQFDGYPSGHGAELAGFLTSRPFVNGISGDRNVFNGMGCFAAQLVGHLKRSEAGGVYLYPAGSSDVGEEYVYEVRGGLDDSLVPKAPVVACIAYGEKAFDGSAEEFEAFCAAEPA